MHLHSSNIGNLEVLAQQSDVDQSSINWFSDPQLRQAYRNLAARYHQQEEEQQNLILTFKSTSGETFEEIRHRYLELNIDPPAEHISSQTHNYAWTLAIHSSGIQGVSALAKSLVYSSQYINVIPSICPPINTEGHPPEMVCLVYACELFSFFTGKFTKYGTGSDSNLPSDGIKPSVLFFEGAIAVYRQLSSFFRRKNYTELLIVPIKQQKLFAGIRASALYYGLQGIPSEDLVGHSCPMKNRALQIWQCCTHCKIQSEDLTRCSRCQLAAYCGKRCQLDDWKACHQHECKVFRDANERIVEL